MAYEWDPAKAQANAAKHGLQFSDAISALEDDRALTQQDLFSDDEERWTTIGRDMLGRVVVVFTHGGATMPG